VKMHVKKTHSSCFDSDLATILDKLRCRYKRNT